MINLNNYNQLNKSLFISFVAALHFFSFYFLFKNLIEMLPYFLVTYVVISMVSYNLLKLLDPEHNLITYIYKSAYIGLIINLLFIILPKLIQFSSEGMWFIILEIGLPTSFVIMLIMTSVLSYNSLNRTQAFYSKLCKILLFYLVLAVSVFFAGVIPIVIINPII